MPRRPAPPVARPAPVPVSARPRWLRPAVLALAALALMAWCSMQLSDPDTWWHLKTGQYMLQHHTLPVPDPFAFTTYTGKPAYPGEEATRYFNLTHEWLAQILFYLVYAAAGFPGLVLMRAAFLTAFCGIVGLAAYNRTESFYRGVWAALAASTVAYQFPSERPQLITYVLLAATLVIVESRRRLWLLPPMFLLWANFHGGFFMGWVVLGVYCAEALYLRLRGRPPAYERQLWLASLAAILVSGLNPNGFRVIPVMIWYRKSIMQASLLEWQYPLPWPPSPFSVLLVCALAVLVWQRRRTRPADWLLLAIFGAASATALRNIILAAFVPPILIFSYVPWKRSLSTAAEYALAGLILLFAAVRMAQPGKTFQLHAADWKYPAGAAGFLLAHHIGAPMFNTYETGGYLIWKLWPQERVFIDGRALNEGVYLDYQRIAANAAAVNGKGADELLNQYGIEVILMNGFEYTSGQVYWLPAALSDPKQTEWKLVYRDAQAVVYMRHPPADVQPLNTFDALAGLEEQCATYLEHDPERPRCALGLSDLFNRIGDPARAARWHATYLRYPDNTGL